jgi:hypothetical protein
MEKTKDMKLLNDEQGYQKLKTWLKTTRIQTAMVTALALWIGHVTVAPLSFKSSIFLGAVGVLIHIWGFTLNEVEDYKYDLKNSDADGHPIAQGKVHAGSARILAWIAAVLAVVTMLVSGAGMLPTTILLCSFVPGFAYDKFSKKHWWANGYLSAWAVLMVLAGATYAGYPTRYTVIIAAAIGIQIFVQVIQGDLKDISGEESTFAGACGVKKSSVRTDLLNIKPENSSIMEIMSYSKLFTGTVYTLKFIEAMLIFLLVILTIDNFENMAHIWAASAFIVGIMFMATTSMFLVYMYDRDTIKKNSSIHELTSVLLLGLAVVGLDLSGAILIMFAPIAWYLLSNVVLNVSALNPDI